MKDIINLNSRRITKACKEVEKEHRGVTFSMTYKNLLKLLELFMQSDIKDGKELLTFLNNNKSLYTRGLRFKNRTIIPCE